MRELLFPQAKIGSSRMPDASYHPKQPDAYDCYSFQVGAVKLSFKIHSHAIHAVSASPAVVRTSLRAAHDLSGLNVPSRA